MQRFVEETNDISFVADMAKATFIQNKFSLQNGRKLSKVNQYLFWPSNNRVLATVIAFIRVYRIEESEWMNITRKFISSCLLAMFRLEILKNVILRIFMRNFNYAAFNSLNLDSFLPYILKAVYVHILKRRSIGLLYRLHP